MGELLRLSGEKFRTSLLLLWVAVAGIVAAQTASPPAPASEPQQDAAAADVKPVEASGYEKVRSGELTAWQNAEREIKQKIDTTCNPDRAQSLAADLLKARAAYDAANKNFWIYQKQLVVANIDVLTSNDTSDESYPVDDLKKDLSDAQQELDNKAKEKAAAADQLEKLKADLAQKTAGNKKDETGLQERVEAQQQLIETLDDVLKTAQLAVERKQSMVDLATNLKDGKLTLRKKWELIGDQADKMITAADDEAKKAREGITLYRTLRLSACIRSAPARSN